MGRFHLLTVYLDELVLRQSSCDGEAPLQLLHLNLWVLHIRMLKDIFVIPEFNGQFDKLTDLTEGLFPVPELAEGAYLFVALAHAAATFVNFAYAEW